jgi:hypothetical protein
MVSAAVPAGKTKPARFERNAAGKFECPQADCDRKGENGFDRPQAVGAHLKFTHGIAGSSASTVAARKAKATSTESKRYTSAGAIVKQNGHARAEFATPLSHSRRMTIDREAQIDAHTNAVAVVEEYLNHCPRCGSDLAKIRDVTDTIPNKCPDCRLNLASVAAALTPDLLTLDPNRVNQVFTTIQSIIRKGF